MNEQKQSWSDQIDQVTNEIDKRCKPLTDKEFNWKPSSDQWSIGQVLHHLILINESYYPVITEFRSGTLFISKFKFVVSFLGNFILKSVTPDRRKKIKTFPIWQPAESDISPDILSEFKAHQKELQAFMVASEDLVERNIVIHSPANKNIVYTLNKTFDILVAHEERHLNQILEILDLMKRK